MELCRCTQLLVLTWNVYVSELAVPVFIIISSHQVAARAEVTFPSPPYQAPMLTQGMSENTGFHHYAAPIPCHKVRQYRWTSWKRWFLSFVPLFCYAFLLLFVLPFHCSSLFWPGTHMFKCDFKYVLHKNKNLQMIHKNFGEQWLCLVYVTEMPDSFGSKTCGCIRPIDSYLLAYCSGYLFSPI